MPIVRRSPAATAGAMLYAGEPLPHFNEVDECAGLDGLMTYRVHKALGQPVENTLHDLRWGDWDRSGTVEDYVWVFVISGSVPAGPFRSAAGPARSSERQPAMYFRLGGGTLKGISKPGEIVWSRIFIDAGPTEDGSGPGRASSSCPREETERRWQATTPAMADHARRDLRRLARSDDGPAQEQSHPGRLRRPTPKRPTGPCWPKRPWPTPWAWKWPCAARRKDGRAW